MDDRIADRKQRSGAAGPTAPGRLRIPLRLWPYLFLAPFLLVYLSFNLYPIFYSLLTSFTKWDGIGAKTYVGLDNFIAVVGKDPYFWKSIGNTLLLMAMSTPFVILFGLLLANALFQLNRGRSLVQTVNFLPYITTPVAIGLIFAILFDWTSGTVNVLLMKSHLIQEGINWLGEPLYARLVVAFMIIWKYTGYHMAIYLAGMSTISPELYEAAKVDGSSPFHSFRKITVPLLAPITLFLVLTDLIGGLQMFDEPRLLFANIGAPVGGPERALLTAVWHYYDVTFSSMRFGYGSSVAFTLFLVIIGFTLVGYAFMGRKERT